MTMHVTLIATFLNGFRLTRTFHGCLDIVDALDRFAREVRGNPINLGSYQITGLRFGFEQEASHEL